MKIPTKFQLGGVTWKVVRRKRLKGRYGDTMYQKQLIQLLDTVPQEVMEQTFCHELLHAIEIARGINPDDHNEEEIDSRATFLHQFLNSAE